LEERRDGRPLHVMDLPGKNLKRERVLRNLTLEEVSKSTRIKENILRAIEEDRYDLCPPPFYVKGFLTSYARYLGIDPKEIILNYQEFIKPPAPPLEVVLREKPKETLQFQARIQTKTTSRVLFISALLVSLLIPLYFYYTFQPATPPNVPALTEQKQVSLEVAPDKENPPPLGQEKPIVLELNPGKGNPPVLNQIKQMELIGPKEVQAEPFSKVLEAHLGTGIDMENGRPMVTGKGSEFRCENQRVYFFTRIMTPKEGKIFHVWRWEGEELRRIEIPVKPPAWSVYSYINLPPARFGSWKVEVWDGDKMLTHASFKAHQPNDSSSPPKKETSS
jgi:transcriptional regulator with XRE-family HTH domain